MTKLLYLILFLFPLITLNADFTKGACIEDSKKYCPDQNGKDRAKCMKKNYKELSDACKENMDYFQNRGKRILKACKTDIEEHCNSSKAGEGKKIQCLRSKMNQISLPCKTEISKKE
jgi:hypothetical protein